MILIPETKKEYNLRIVPSSPIFEEVAHFKKQFRAVFGKQLFLNSEPHITIAAFDMYTEYQDILIRVLDQLSGFGQFELEIEGFDIFENSDTLHLKILNSEEIKMLHRDFKILWIRDLHRKLKTLKISSTPHMTISRTSGKKMLYESLAFFKEIVYSKSFEVNGLTLVSKHKGKSWDWRHFIELKRAQ